MTESRVTMETVKRMVGGGIIPGTYQTEFGETVVKKALLNGQSIFSITFTEMEEKWAVVGGGDIIAAKYVPTTAGEGVMHQGTEGQDRSNYTDTQDRENYVTGGMKLIPTKEKKVEKRKEVKPKVKAKTGPKVEVPRSERPKTDISKAQKAGLPIKEQPPTRRAFIGKKAQAKVTVKKGPQGLTAKVLVPMRKPRKPQVKVEKIGAPVWRRQLNWKGEPEKVNIKMFPVKVVCAICGQPRYIDYRNAGVKAHPVTLCKPHARREHDDRHNAMLRKRTAEKRAAALKAAKLACKALPKVTGKAPALPQNRRSGVKGTPIASKGAYKGRKARGRSEG